MIYSKTNSNAWYLVEKNGEYFVEHEVELKHTGWTKLLFRDFNNNIMSLGKNKQWAEDWIKTKNEVDGYTISQKIKKK